MMAGAGIVEFQSSLYNLRDFPDKNLIDQLTSFAQSNRFAFATEIVNTVCNKLLDSSIPAQYKLPVFYLMDSIMKYTREPYIPLFSFYLEKLDGTFFQQFSEQLRGKLIKLFGTWEERTLLATPLLNQLRHHLANAPYPNTYSVNNVNVNNTYQISYQQPVPQDPRQQWNVPAQINFVNQQYTSSYVNQVPTTGYSTQPITSHVPVNRDIYATQKQNVSTVKRPRDLPSLPETNLFRNGRGGHVGKVIDPRKNVARKEQAANKRTKFESDFEISVRNEMQSVLNQLLSDLNQPNDEISLDDLAQENPPLYQNIRTQAESIVNARMQATNYPIIVPSVEETSILQQKTHADVNVSSNILPGSDRSVSAHETQMISSSIEDMTEQYNTTINDNQTITHSTVGNISIEWGTGIESGHFQDHSNGVDATNLGNTQDNTILGFINEAPVILNTHRAEYLSNQLLSSDGLFALSSDAIENCRLLTQRIQSYVNRLKLQVKIPPIIFGQLPTEPSETFLNSFNPQTSMKPIQKLNIPVFRYDELNNKPDVALKSLYQDRPYLAEDGQRFKSADQLRKHTDSLITVRIEKKKKQLKGESEIMRRPWYVPVATWTRSDSQKNDERNDQFSKNPTIDNAEEYVVPADENFVRCPISKEAFEKFWDDNEGEYMYRNAVKLLVTQEADAHVYSLGRPTMIPNIRYMIVHKLLVVDTLISSGKSTSLEEAIKRYRSMGKDEQTLKELLVAAGDEDVEDIFILLELVK